MPSLSQSEARTQFAELLGDAVYQALGLKQSLGDERDALEKQDVEAIGVAVDCKLTCVNELQRLDEKRDEFCQSLGFESGPNQIKQIIEWCDEDDLIGERWNQLMVIAAESSALNMTNGAIIRVRQQHFESSLSVLRGGMPGSDTYGRDGADAGDYGRRSIAQA